MSKYDRLWNYVQNRNESQLKMTFDEVREAAGIEIDHSFLNYKKELIQYGYQVGKISLKEKTVIFNRIV